MAKWIVTVCRVAHSSMEIEVEAESFAEACHKGCDAAGDHVFPSAKDASYEAEHAEVIEED